ncbi:PilN domain-containing protein [Serratia quinivorans]|uniref:PilN domain-containing protein n=1 Tax=Serratia quinivorans TaxID=137545 RepID=UPI00217A51D8|nr:PilN domain-containing protein [Serratia quinivorans]CAI1862371.1 Fimbrial assembly protein (PilN) [Serratia quinivorans]CAI1965109.1 Fimbrial assembly protein (PilN) [Serratia quinivorans]
MYQVNLLPWRIGGQRRRYAFWLRVFILQLVLVLAALMVVFGLLSQQQAQRHEALLMLSGQQTELTERYQQLQQAVARLARLTALAQQHDNNRVHNRRYLQLLQQLSSLLPAPVWLIALESHSQNITLRGLGRRYEAVLQFEQQLTALPLLQNYRLAEVVQRQDGLFSFTLMAQWGPGG